MSQALIEIEKSSSIICLIYDRLHNNVRMIGQLALWFNESLLIFDKLWSFEIISNEAWTACAEITLESVEKHENSFVSLTVSLCLEVWIVISLSPATISNFFLSCPSLSVTFAENKRRIRFLQSFFIYFQKVERSWTLRVINLFFVMHRVICRWSWKLITYQLRFNDEALKCTIDNDQQRNWNRKKILNSDSKAWMTCHRRCNFQLN